MTLLKDIGNYFSVFRKHLGNRLYIVFFLTGLAVATEAVGIAMLLPLLELMEAGQPDTEPTRVTLVLQSILHGIGIGDSMAGILIFIAAAFALKGMVKFGEGAYKATLAANLLREIKGGLFGYYSNMDYRFYTGRHTGHFVNVISQQVNRLMQAFESYKKFLSEVIITVLYLVFAFIIAWEFALMAAVAGLLTLYLFTRLNAYVKKLSRRTSDEYSSLHHLLVQTLQAFPYISATGRFDRPGNRVGSSVHRLTRYYRNQQIAQSFTQAIREPLSVLLILFIVILQITVFEARIAPILVSLLLIYRAMNHVFSLQISWQQTMNMAGGLEMVEQEFEEIRQYQEQEGSREISGLKDSLQFENVSFTWPGRDEPVLEDISMEIKARSAVALFGPSGSGKTTLINMLTLLLPPDRGRITIDGIPHDQINKHSWRKRIGYVPQETVIFDDTIANNISFWEGEDLRDRELRNRVEAAAERANAMEFIRGLPEGLDTRVGDRGVRLSGGQKQRISIARELFKEPELLILDEATSALDSDSEKYIHESIRQLKGSLTIVLIAHRLSTIRFADQIFVLDNRRIVTSGSYEDLVNRDASFRRIAEMQQL